MIDYEKTIATLPVGSNISRPELLANINNKGDRPFIAGSSRYNDTAVFLANYRGYMSRALSNSVPTSEGDYAFATPITFTVYKASGSIIKGLAFQFDNIVEQFPTRLTVDGVAFNNNKVKLDVNVADGLKEYVVRITHWNKPNANVRITSISTSDDEIIEINRIGLTRSTLQPCPKFFSSWVTKNILTDMTSPSRVLDATLIRSGDMYYLPEVTFDYKFLTPQEHSFMVQILNAPEFVIEYYDQEMLRTVIRKMYTAELSSNRPLAFSRVYKGIVGQKYRMVSYFGYNVKDANGNIIGYADLYARATNDTRF